LSGILDVDFRKPSEVAEYIVRTVPEGDRRDMIFDALMYADEGFNNLSDEESEVIKDGLQGLKDMLEKANTKDR